MCDALGLTNPSHSVSLACDTAHRRTIAKREISTVTASDISFPNRGMLCVSEAGIYDLINLSKKPAAKAFRKWVNGTVLPRLRKNGSYIAGEEKIEDGTATLDEMELFRTAITTATSRIETRTEKLKEAREELTETRSAWAARVSAVLAEQARRWHEGREGIGGPTVKTLTTAAALALVAASATAQEVPVGEADLLIYEPGPDATRVEQMLYWCAVEGGVLVQGADTRGAVFCVDTDALISLPSKFRVPLQENE